MKRFIIFILTLSVILPSALSQEMTNSLLWKISGNNLEKPSYLYGTFHLLCPDELDIKDKVKNVLGKSSQMVMELNFDDPNVMATIQQQMIYRDGTTAKDYLNEKEYLLVSEFFKDSLQIPFERINSMKPFFLSSMTLMHFLDCQPVSFEQTLNSIAKNSNMEVKGLETVQEQISFIESIPLEKQKKMLVENLRDYKDSKEMFDKMVRLYLNEELAGLNTLMEEYMTEDYANIKHNLLVNRNKNWVGVITNMIQEDSSFIAVGAGHLPGEEGLINLLRKEGYTVEGIK